MTRCGSARTEQFPEWTGHRPQAVDLLKGNAVLQSLAWKARQLRSRDGMLPDQLNLPNQLREINHLHCGLCAKSTKKLWRDQCKARVDDTLRYNETPSWTI